MFSSIQRTRSQRVPREDILAQDLEPPQKILVTSICTCQIYTDLKGQSYENVCEIIALNDRLDSN
jgi:hypothetical protein